MDEVIYVVHQITSNKFWVIVIALFLLLISFTRKKLIPVGILIVILAVLNFLYGERLTNRMVYRHGENGNALITRVEQTNDMYNHRYVMEYTVILNTAGDTRVNTTFRSDDFNIYPPPKTGYSYPRPGIPFDIKYVETYPGIFIIVSK